MSAAQETIANIGAICTEDEATAWAAEHLTIDKSRRVRNAPWSQVFRLRSGNADFYLKVAPPAVTVAPALQPLLAELFPGRVPATIASDANRGLLLMRATEGVILEHDLTDEQRARVVSTYGELQAASVADSRLLSLLPSTEPLEQLSRLLEWLGPDSKLCDFEGAPTSASDIMGKKLAARYYEPLVQRRHLLEEFLSQAAVLPATLNHGDLRPPNTAISHKGECEIFDWDDASVGPAGLSLHGLFSGCSIPARLLADDDLGDKNRAGRKWLILDAYIDALVSNGYAEREVIKRGLGASICAGVMHYMLGYSRFRIESRLMREETADVFARRLSDILDLCDFLSLADRQRVISFAKDYEDRDRQPRAESMLSRHLWRSPNDAEAHGLYANLLHQRRSYERAKRHYQQALEITPNSPDLLRRSGDLHLEKLEFDKAISLYRRSLNIDSSFPRAAQHLEYAFELQRAATNAKKSDCIPKVVVSAKEFENKSMGRPKRALAVKLFLEYGVLIVENVFEKALIEACRASYFEKYQAYFENRRHSDALRIGDKRFQVTMAIEGPINNEEFYGNQLVLPLLNEWLDERFVFGSLTASTSLPGSKEQWIHKDYPRLFSKHADNLPTPPFGVSMMVPLVDLNKKVGTTKVKKKSHLVSLRDSSALGSLSPYIDVGSCFFMDQRLSHKGEPNRSQDVRPVFNALYHRQWFRDALNFTNQAPLRISAAEFEKVPNHLKRLLQWTRDPWPSDSHTSS